MRITTSDNYYGHGRQSECPFEDCERFYCNDHRTLYRTCDSAYKDSEGDGDVPNGTRTFWDSTNECPACLQDSRLRKSHKDAELYELEMKRRVG